MSIWRAFSALFAGFAAWAAAMQLNDPDPERWTAFYTAAAVLGLAHVLARPLPRATVLLCIVALGWAAAIVPELIGHWQVSDLGATMSRERPEVEFGREFGGLLIVAAYGALALRVGRRQTLAATQRRPGSASSEQVTALSDPPNAA